MLIPGAPTSGPRDLASPESDSPAPPQIREEIDKFGIHVYQFPECDSDEDEDFKQQDRELKVTIVVQWTGRELEASLHGPREGLRAQVQPLGGGALSLGSRPLLPGARGLGSSMSLPGVCIWSPHS